MKEYEYRIEQIKIDFNSILREDKKEYNEDIIKILNLLGKDGWELSSVDGTWFYFKRELNSN